MVRKGGFFKYLGGPFSSGIAILAALIGLSGCLPGGFRISESPLLSALERKSGLIVYLGNDGNLYTINQVGGHQQAVTTDAAPVPDGSGSPGLFYQFPTWSPDGKRLAFVSIEASQLVDAVTLFTAKPDGGDRLEVFKSKDWYPFYLYWSPNSEILSFLASGAQTATLALHTVPAGGGEAQLLSSGSPLYWVWAPDNQRILVHQGGAYQQNDQAGISVYSVEENRQELTLTVRPTFFQTPDWSPDGEKILLAGGTEEDEHDLILADRSGQVEKVLAPVEGMVAFSWSPNGERVAYFTGDLAGPSSTTSKLTVLDPQRPETASISENEGVIAFFWSPDSRKIAYFVADIVQNPNAQEGNGSSVVLRAYVMNVRSGISKIVSTFLPTNQFLNLLPFFDQYQRSATIWSPDSRNLVLSGFDGEGNPGIFVVDSSGRPPPQQIASGSLAFWSWR